MVIGAGLVPQIIATLTENTFLACVRHQFPGQRLSVHQVRRLYGLAAQAYGCHEATQTLHQMAQLHADTLALLDVQAEQLLQTLLALFLALPKAPDLLSIQGLTAPAALGCTHR